jgi:hypothetical protein
MQSVYASPRNSPTATKVCFPAAVFHQDNEVNLPLPAAFSIMVLLSLNAVI